MTWRDVLKGDPAPLAAGTGGSHCASAPSGWLRRRSAQPRGLGLAPGHPARRWDVALSPGRPLRLPARHPGCTARRSRGPRDSGPGIHRPRRGGGVCAFDGALHGPLSHPDLWTVLEYPYFGYSVLGGLDALGRLGHSREQQKVAAALDYVLSRQRSDGTWSLDGTPRRPLRRGPARSAEQVADAGCIAGDQTVQWIRVRSEAKVR